MDRALVLLYLDERSHREIAEVLGISEGNVATKLSRLKARIRDSLS
jgi:RNA polymerase sigma-70 factor (ECF subfamily)